MDSSSINPNRLPSGSFSQFVVIVITAAMLSFWTGQFLPSADQLLSVAHPDQIDHRLLPGRGIYGVIISFTLAITFFALHPFERRRSFGAHDFLGPENAARKTIDTLASDMGVQRI
jgi:hypothetical protein